MLKGAMRPFERITDALIRRCGITRPRRKSEPANTIYVWAVVAGALIFLAILGELIFWSFF